MSGTPPTPDGCPADPLLRLLWGQWKANIVYLLGAHGPTRFGVLRQRLEGISPKVLTQRLRELEAAGLLWREQEPTVPPKVNYGLTEMGRDVHGALKALDAPARRWLPQGRDDGGER